MRIYVFRMLFILCLLLAYAPVSSWLDKTERKAGASRLFRLSEPLPVASVRNRGYQPPLQIERVVIRGRFSNWALDDPFYRLQKNDRGEWQIRLRLGPGEHPYQFVVHLRSGSYPPGAAGVLILPDPLSQEKKDNMGRTVSVLEVPNVKSVRLLIRFIMLSLVGGLLLFSIMELIITQLMFSRVSLRWKMTLIFMFFLLMSNLFYVFFTSYQRRDFGLQIQIDKINMLHNMLLTAGVDFNRLEARTEQEKISGWLEQFFRHVNLRQDYGNFSNSKIQLTRVSVLDSRGRMIVNRVERGLLQFLRTRFGDGPLLETYFRDVTGRIFASYRNSSHFNRDLFAVLTFDYFSPEFRTRSGLDNMKRYREATRFFHYNGFVYPIYHRHRLCGYYFFEANGESYSTLFGEMFKINMAMLGVITALFFLLIRRVGSIILYPLLALVEGIRRINRGDYNYMLQIESGDEVEHLGNAYNFMREQLLASRREIDHYTRHLEAEVEDRARELKEKNNMYKEDLLLAQRVQQNILPKSFNHLQGLQLDAVYKPLNEVGGDFFDVEQLAPDRIRIFLADATGHGMPAALVSMLIKSEYEKAKMFAPSEILSLMNDQFVSTYRSLTVFFTGVIVDIDLGRRQLHYVSAGHSHQFLYRRGELIQIRQSGMIVGVMDNQEYETRTYPFEPGDLLLLFTDGIFEQFDSAGKELGLSGFREIFNREVERGLLSQPIEKILPLLEARTAEFRGGALPGDDITMIAAMPV